MLGNIMILKNRMGRGRGLWQVVQWLVVSGLLARQLF